MPESAAAATDLCTLFFIHFLIVYILSCLFFFFSCVIVRFEKLEVAARDDDAIRAILKWTLDYIFYNL